MKSRVAASGGKESMEAGSRQKRPLVIVRLGLATDSQTPQIVELAKALDWQVLDLRFYDGLLPPGLRPQGAFVDCLPTDPFVRQLLKRGCHVVRLGEQPHPRDRVVPTVIEDLAAAGRLAAEHFAERQFRHAGFVGYHPLSDYKRLYEGMRDRAVQLGCAVHLLEFHELDKQENALPMTVKFQLRNREFAEWIAQVPKPVGVLVSNDYLAGRLCGVALQAGVVVPAEVAMLGHGDSVTTCESAPVPLSSIRLGMGRGEAAVRVMRELLAGKPGPGAVFVPPVGVVLRASTDVLASADPAVAAALRYLWDHLDMSLSVSDVARAVGVSRRQLDRKFSEQLGRGVNAELRRKRLEVFRERLTTTHRPILELGPAVGFSTMVHLQRCFRRAYGMSPRQYRTRYNRIPPVAQ